MRRCHVCGLALAGRDVHRFDRDCVEALRQEVERLQAAVHKDRHSTTAFSDTPPATQPD